MFLVIFNNAIKRDGEPNFSYLIPRTSEDAIQARLNDGRVLHFEKSCSDE